MAPRFLQCADDVVAGGDLPATVANAPASEPAIVPAAHDDGDVPTLTEAERRVIAAALRKSGGNKNEAARILGIDRQRLYRKIDKYRL